MHPSMPRRSMIAALFVLGCGLHLLGPAPSAAAADEASDAAASASLPLDLVSHAAKPETTPWISVNRGLLSFSAGADGQPVTLMIDSTASDAAWNQAITIEPGVLEPDRRYRVDITYRVIEGPDADAFFYIAPKARGEVQPWIQMITFQGNAGDERTLVQRRFLPEAEAWTLAVGVKGKGKLEIEKLTVAPAEKLTQEQLLAPGDPVETQEPFEPFGICAHMEKMELYETDAEVDRAIKLLGESGAQWVRVCISWSQLQPDGPDSVDLDYVERIDRIVAGLRARGISIFMQPFYTPRWASTRPDHHAYWAHAPVEVEPWREFIRFVVDRYGDRVRHWEIGNEVDWHFWLSSLESYVELLRIAHAELKAAGPQHLVLGPALATDGVSVGTTEKGGEIDALQRLYDLGLAQYTDIISDHFYPRDAAHAVYRVNALHAIMASNGDADKPIWITETGMPTGDPRFSESDQAQLVTDMYHALTRHPHVEKVFWWNLRNTTPDSTKRIGTYGLVEHDFALRPSFRAFKDMPKPSRRFVNPDLAEVE